MGNGADARSPRRGWMWVCLGMVGVAGPGGAAAGDEDYRKLLDRLPPVVAPPLVGQALPATGGRAGGFDAENMTLYAWLPLNTFPGEPTTGNDCWGYISPSGREYAIMGLANGFGFVEVTDPIHPTIVAHVEGPHSLWHDVKVIGDYAYGVSEGGWGIQIMDLSRIDEGIVRHVRDWTVGGYRTTHNIAANPESGYLYLCGANVANGGLVAIDVTDPENPVMRGAWTSEYVHDAQIVTYTEGPYAGREIAFCSSAGGDVDVVDFTNKSNPVRLGGASYPGQRYTHQAWLTEDRRYLYVDDELDEGSTTETTRTLVFDVVDPGHPRLVGNFTTGVRATDHNQYVRGDLLFQANYRSGLRVWDISDPLDPQPYGYFDTFPDADGPGFNGAWSTFPYFPSGTIIVSDIERGLFVLRPGTSELEFAFPGGLPTQLEPNRPTPIAATITENGATLDPDSVAVHVSFDGAPPVVAPLSSAGGGAFAGQIPAGECFQEARYWFSALTIDGREFTSPFLPFGEMYVADIITGTADILADDFETDTGWTVVDEDVASGGWERGVPDGSGQNEAPRTDADGSGSCWVTGLAPNVDLDGGPTILTSPAFDLGAYPEARIGYAVWFSTYVGVQSRLDVEASGDDGATWVRVERLTGGYEAWRWNEFRVADFVTPSAAVRVRFVASEMMGTTEAAVDALTIYAHLCDACSADFNQDGALDAADFAAFRAGFLAGDDAADFDGDGSLGAGDFTAFRDAFLAGCD